MAPGFDQKYPKGRLSAEDEGELTTRIALDLGTKTLIIDYGKPIQWLGLDEDAVMQLITVLAQNLATMKGLPVSIVMGDPTEKQEGDRYG